MYIDLNRGVCCGMYHILPCLLCALIVRARKKIWIKTDKKHIYSSMCSIGSLESLKKKNEQKSFGKNFSGLPVILHKGKKLNSPKIQCFFGHISIEKREISMTQKKN